MISGGEIYSFKFSKTKKKNFDPTYVVSVNSKERKKNLCFIFNNQILFVIQKRKKNSKIIFMMSMMIMCVCTVYTHQIHHWYLIWWSYLTNIITESERERKKWLQIVNCFSFLVIIYSIFFLFLWFHHNNQPPTIATTTKQPK